MKHNATISSWFNGFDFSLKRLSHQTFAELLKNLATHAGRPVNSIAEAYTVLFEKLPTPAERVAAQPRLMRASELASPFLRPLAELQAYVSRSFSSEELVGFYVHGSFATMDYSENFSDLDTLVILRKEVADDPKWAMDVKRRLSRSNTFLYLMDPLQHHHHFTLTEYDLAHYFEPIFPLILFEYAVELTGFGNKLTFHCHTPDSSLREPLAASLGYFESYWPSMQRLRAYDVKNAVSNILLLPALYLQCKTGKYLYKRDTFERAKPDFEPALWSIVERASQVRGSCAYRSAYPYLMRWWHDARRAEPAAGRQSCDEPWTRIPPRTL
ncbi:MAG: nucleotidyltransferase domain-containing protein [Deltaproteobacteria bacterium]|nr:nucleotidyltransferase domain-containing protein [Deltaproteobacteria bacterium]